MTIVNPAADPEVIDVRPDEGLDRSRLEPWLRARLPAAAGPLSIRQFGGGHANLTYLLQFGAAEYVLRRPPLGPVAPTAHDMAREHRVLARLGEAFPLAPRSFALCTDPDILGVDFHVLERRRGIVIRRDLPPVLHDRPDLRRRVGEMIVDVLADLHAVDPAAVGLGDLGRPEGFARRQLDGWGRRWHAAKDRDVADVDRMLRWLDGGVPAPQGTALLHNDYKLDNLMVDAADPATPVAVFDWDMATRGDPLMDVGYLLNFWNEPGDDPRWHHVSRMPTNHSGLPRSRGRRRALRAPQRPRPRPDRVVPRVRGVQAGRHRAADLHPLSARADPGRPLRRLRRPRARPRAEGRRADGRVTAAGDAPRTAAGP